MKSISEWLQTNPVVVLVMFIVSLLSGISGLVLGWDQLYKDYLSKSIQIPVWVMLLFILLLPAVIALSKRLRSNKEEKDLIKVEGAKFGVQQVSVDGKSFERCEFHGSEMIFEGNKPFSLISCKFIPPRFAFGRHAALTISVMTTMYKDPAFQPLIEATLANIKAGVLPQATAPSSLS